MPKELQAAIEQIKRIEAKLDTQTQQIAELTQQIGELLGVIASMAAVQR